MFFKDVLLELKNGCHKAAHLNHTFDPLSDQIEIIENETNKTKIFQRHDICCIKMIPEPDWLLSSSGEWKRITVTTEAKKSYSVYKINGSDKRGGFFAINTAPNGDGDFKLIYFYSGTIQADTDKSMAERMRSQGSFKNGLTNVSKGDGTDEINNDQSIKYMNGSTSANTNGVSPRNGNSQIKLGQILVHANLITEHQLSQSLSEQKIAKGKKLGEVLLAKRIITEEQLLRSLAIKLRLPFVDLKNIIPDKTALSIVTNNVAKSLNIFPVEYKDGQLVIATSEPGNLRTEDLMRFSTGEKIQFVVSTSKQISEAITNYYFEGNFGVRDLFEDGFELRTSWEDEVEQVDQITEADSLIINLVNRIMKEAYVKGSSDVHFEPGLRKDPSQVRFRIDGVCSVAHYIPSIYKRAISSRIKILSHLDIAERRKPQSGKIAMGFGNERVEYRVEITPTAGDNEDIVLRLLRSSKLYQIEELGFADQNLTVFKELISKPYGMILCVGPTGSGKTTTLHAALAHLNVPERKIWTVEDPVEITQKGLRQVQVNTKIGYSFEDALRSFLRADPDVIMIGEMRDAETAKTAVNAALTGHLVLSTLHTNDAPETLLRLIEMGMNPLNFADAILGVVAQRLTRSLCEFCKEPYHPDIHEYEKLKSLYGAESDILPRYSDNLILMRAKGCSRCDGKGYKGRIALHEVLKTTREVKKAIKENRSVEEVRTLAIEQGMGTLLMDGILKIFQGVTDLKQVMRVAM